MTTKKVMAKKVSWDHHLNKGRGKEGSFAEKGQTRALTNQDIYFSTQ